ncbi:hypothetical protein RvY_10173 [Ramazzottius varieornatus]|uniref:Uncharacterized protein n=1 Tax=Ramazzottius varieornatus TaxID=947166 RepID=A0A1D1VBX1_RAMVA|nr:hypothetical protein RvY_10173 [Ramazzottius varieornatus]
MFLWRVFPSFESMISVPADLDPNSCTVEEFFLPSYIAKECHLQMDDRSRLNVTFYSRGDMDFALSGKQ